MPNRRHLWRGIHDRDMVRQALSVDLQHRREGDEVQAVLTVTNSGAGHYFPTYLTPRVLLRLDLIDAAGRRIDGSLRQEVIGREVPLNLSRELRDTRLAPRARVVVNASWTVARPGLRLRARIVVEPDYFYSKFFEAVIPGATEQRASLEEALRRTRQSPFTIFSREIDL